MLLAVTLPSYDTILVILSQAYSHEFVRTRLYEILYTPRRTHRCPSCEN